MLETTIAHLTEHGYIQYEISNYAKSSEKISRHNTKYWSSGPYIGLGPSAHSLIPTCRYWNHANLDRYTEDIFSGMRPIAGNEVLSREEQITEAIYLGLRTTKGIDIEGFNERFRADFFDMFQQTIQILLREGMIQTAGIRCALTRRGMLFLDSIAGMFITAYP
jgi:oxygen-independent coproporphyrinogen-3 oxidase